MKKILKVIWFMAKLYAGLDILLWAFAGMGVFINRVRDNDEEIDTATKEMLIDAGITLEWMIDGIKKAFG